MDARFILLIPIALGAGVITAISPCVFPVLPILFAGGVGATRRKPYAIIAGLVTSFATFTLVATWLLDKLGLPQDFLRDLSIGLLFLLAPILIFPQVGALAAPAIPSTGDQKLQTWFPDYTHTLQGLERSSVAHKELAKLQRRGKPRFVAQPSAAAAASLKDYGSAPDLHGISAWLNSKPL